MFFCFNTSHSIKLILKNAHIPIAYHVTLSFIVGFGGITMYNIHIIKSNNVYQGLLDQDYKHKKQYFKDHLLKFYKEKFEIQNIPYDSEHFDALSLLNATHVSPQAFNTNHMKEVALFDDVFWNDCQQALTHAISQFELKGILSRINQYTFTVLLGDKEKPSMYLNQNYGGDGGVPGYVYISLVPNEYTLDRVKSAIAHEMNHNFRYQYIRWDGGSLAELIVAEGLAENFVEKLYGKDYLGPWVTTINWSEQQEKIKSIIEQHLHISNSFEAMPYLYGDEITTSYGGQPVGLPHAAGYTCGYYLIKYYLEKTECTIEKATIKSADDILREVYDFWITNTV